MYLAPGLSAWDEGTQSPIFSCSLRFLRVRIEINFSRENVCKARWNEWTRKVQEGSSYGQTRMLGMIFLGIWGRYSGGGVLICWNAVGRPRSLPLRPMLYSCICRLPLTLVPGRKKRDLTWHGSPPSRQDTLEVFGSCNLHFLSSGLEIIGRIWHPSPKHVATFNWPPVELSDCRSQFDIHPRESFKSISLRTMTAMCCGPCQETFTFPLSQPEGILPLGKLHQCFSFHGLCLTICLSFLLTLALKLADGGKRLLSGRNTSSVYNASFCLQSQYGVASPNRTVQIHALLYMSAYLYSILLS